MLGRVVIALGFVGAWLLGAVADTRAAQPASDFAATLAQGTCAEAGPVVYELAGPAAGAVVAGTAVPATPAGADGASQVLQSVTTLPVPLADLLAQPLALVVRETTGRTGSVIACGEVGGLLASQMPGMEMPGDELVIGLREQGDSGYVGIALLTAAGPDVTVRLYLASGLTGEAPAS